MEQLFQILVVRLQTAHRDLVMIGQDEERPRRPALRHGDANLAPAIVVEHLHAFKAQVLQKGIQIALNVQAVTIVTAPAKGGDGAMAQDLAMMENQHSFANLGDVAQQVR